MEIPSVEVRFENLTIESSVYIGSRALPSVLNAYRNFFEVPVLLQPVIAAVCLVTEMHMHASKLVFCHACCQAYGQLTCLVHSLESTRACFMCRQGPTLMRGHAVASQPRLVQVMLSCAILPDRRGVVQGSGGSCMHVVAPDPSASML